MTRRDVFAVGIGGALASWASGEERSQARSMVISRRGIAATSQALASQAGAQVLRRGGSAMDAAIAANATLQVVEPMSCGMGGDLFAIHWNAKTGAVTGINASGWAPKAMTLAALQAKGRKSMPGLGILSATVPGCVDGWEKLHRKFGKLKWAEVFQPAVYYAKTGYPVTEIIHEHWQGALEKLRSDEGARRVFLIDGRAPRVGEVYRNPDMARTLELVAQGGADAFYRGPVAQAIVKTSQRHGGLFDLSDLAEFSSEWIETITTDYRGWKVHELPPNGQGIAALMMLNLMERFPLGEWGANSPDTWHVKMEAQKLAYQDLHRYVADPRQAQVPAAGMLSKKYAAQRAALIDKAKAKCDVAPGNPLPHQGDTIYLSTIDAEGNIASLIQSVYQSFGSGVLVEGMGFHLHNRGALFTMDPQHPNVVAPRKRPFHTIIPAFMEKGGLHIGFGIMGGSNQAQAHAQFVSNIVDHGLNLQGALEAPRFTKLQPGGCDFMIENRAPAGLRAALTARGHKLDVRADYSSTMGGGQAVMRDTRSGVNYAGSSPRKDGAATPEPDPYF
ncbi:MAG: gamma-glutamyltransferase [Acidobacteria bacterium]|nr:gamma-glutamyltransferase [Acidobacteriota bacterium]